MRFTSNAKYLTAKRLPTCECSSTGIKLGVRCLTRKVLYGPTCTRVSTCLISLEAFQKSLSTDRPAYKTNCDGKQSSRTQVIAFEVGLFFPSHSQLSWTSVHEHTTAAESAKAIVLYTSRGLGLPTSNQEPNHQGYPSDNLVLQMSAGRAPKYKSVFSKHVLAAAPSASADRIASVQPHGAVPAELARPPWLQTTIERFPPEEVPKPVARPRATKMRQASPNTTPQSASIASAAVEPHSFSEAFLERVFQRIKAWIWQNPLVWILVGLA